MPIKVYICQKCEHKFEYFHSNKEDKAECPQCHTPEEHLDVDMDSFKNDFKLKGFGWFKGGYSGSDN